MTALVQAITAITLFWPFDRAYMQYALVAGLAVGVSAPLIGTFLVERRMAMLGDGIGHLAFAGVAAGMLAGVGPLWTALAFAVVGAVALELMRSRGRLGGDLALAVVFYSGIAGGVVFAGRAGTYNASMLGYLFGSILTIKPSEAWTTVAIAITVVAVVASLWRMLFVCVTNEEFAATLGLRVRIVNSGIAVAAAVVVVGAMRVVGVLLVAALMVLPVGAARQWARSFRSSLVVASVCGAVATGLGLVAARRFDLPPSGTIVLTSAALVVVSLLTSRAA